MIYKVIYKNVYIEDIIYTPGLYKGIIEDIALSLPYREDYKLIFILYPENSQNFKYCTKDTHIVKENLIYFEKNIKTISSKDFNVYKSNYYNCFIICEKEHNIEKYHYSKKIIKTENDIIKYAGELRETRICCKDKKRVCNRYCNQC